MRLGVALLICGTCACAGRPVVYQPLTPMNAPAGEGPETTPAKPVAGDPPSTPPAGVGPGARPTAPPQKVESDDERLIAGVRRAVSERVAPEAVEAQVGVKPLVSTRNGVSVAVLRRVTLVPDATHADETLDLASADTVMYWRRPIDGEDPHFVGIQIRKDGTPTVFFAILLPP